MTRTLTPERQKLKQDAIQLRQELGWTERRIAEHLSLPCSTIHGYLLNNVTPTPLKNNTHLTPNNIHCMNCLVGLSHLAHDSVDLIFADPPYNLGVNYGNGNSDKHEAYLDWCVEWFKAIYRVLKPGGAFYTVHYPEICAYWLPRLRALRFNLQRWITWHYPTNVGQSQNNWTRSHRTILYCIKGDAPRVFNGLADPQPYRNPTDKRIQENLKTRPGVVPYDTWEYDLVKNVSREKQLKGPPNQIPEALVRRVIVTSSNPGDLVLDPFSGSGTTAYVAHREGRQYMAFDINPDFVKVARQRLGNT